MRILLAGGTGMIGRALARTLIEKGNAVWVLTRRDTLMGMPPGIRLSKWDGKTVRGWSDAAEWAQVIVNLAGENVGAGRWTEARKQAIRSSRVDAGQAIVRAIEAGARPSLLVQASAIGYYGTRQFDTPLNENFPVGEDFLAQVCKEWEESTVSAERQGIRRVILRTGLVLGRDEGVLRRMALPFRLFAGGRLGSGQQWLSWIHLQDEVEAICFLIEGMKEGVFNLTSPQPVVQQVFGKILAKVMRRPYWLPAPAFALRFVLGEMSTLALDGQRVLPERLRAAGFSFRFGDLEEALQDLCFRRPKSRSTGLKV